MSARPGLAVALGAITAVALAAGVAHAQIWRGGFGFYARPETSDGDDVRRRVQPLPADVHERSS